MTEADLKNLADIIDGGNRYFTTNVTRPINIEKIFDPDNVTKLDDENPSSLSNPFLSATPWEAPVTPLSAKTAIFGNINL